MFWPYKIFSKIRLDIIKSTFNISNFYFHHGNNYTIRNTNTSFNSVRHYAITKGFDSRFVIVRVTPKDYENIIDLFRYTYFNCEPSILAAGLAYKQNPILEARLLESLSQGMSLMALCRRSGNIVGAAVNVGQCPWDADEEEEFAKNCTCPKVAELLRFYAYISRSINLFEKYKERKIFEVSCIATDINNQGKGIGFNLTKKSLELAKDLTYNVIRVDATSIYSQKICRKLNMKEEHKFLFKTYVNCDSKPIFLPPPPHESVVVFSALPHSPKK